VSKADVRAHPTLWRTKVRSTAPGVSHAKQVQHCLDRGLVGIGWRIDELVDDTPLDEVCAWIEQCADPGWGRTSAQIVRRFGAKAQVGDFVWTRATAGRYLLAKIAGEYRYMSHAVRPDEHVEPEVDRKD
jgi:hypothetical protein